MRRAELCSRPFRPEVLFPNFQLLFTMAAMLDNANLPPPLEKESILSLLVNTEKKQDAENVFVSLAKMVTQLITFFLYFCRCY